MNINLPQNSIKFTSGGEYILANTQKEYKGYYYVLYNKIYAGEKINANNPELIKITSDNSDEFKNKLLNNNNISSFYYGLISKVNILKNDNVVSIPWDESREVHFFCLKKNTNIIKEIDKETYNILKSDPLYKTTYTGYYENYRYQTPQEAEKDIPGIEAFILSNFLH